jgi:YD repeat-containing protein
MATTYEYVSPGVINVKDAAGKITQLKFTAKGELQSIQDPLNRSTTFSYDTNGYLSQISAPGNTVYKYSYDASGRLLSQTDPLNQTVSFTYSGSSTSPVTVTDQKGNKLIYGYDASGNLTGITYGTNQSETFTYDASGRLTKARDVRGEITTLTCDGIDHQHCWQWLQCCHRICQHHRQCHSSHQCRSCCLQPHQRQTVLQPERCNGWTQDRRTVRYCNSRSTAHRNKFSHSSLIQGYDALTSIA